MHLVPQALIFSYTPMVSLVAFAWNYVLEKFEGNKAVTYGTIGILALTAIEPAYFILKNHDYPYIYFNPVAGGMSGAYGNYETDYWGVSMKQGVEWLEEEGIISENMTDTVTIVSNFSYQSTKF